MHRDKLCEAGIPVYNKNCPKLNYGYLMNKLRMQDSNLRLVIRKVLC